MPRKDRDFQRIEQAIKRHRLDGRNPATPQQINDLCLAIDEVMREIWREEQWMAAAARYEASKILVNS